MYRKHTRIRGKVRTLVSNTDTNHKYTYTNKKKTDIKLVKLWAIVLYGRNIAIIAAIIKLRKISMNTTERSIASGVTRKMT